MQISCFRLIRSVSGGECLRHITCCLQWMGLHALRKSGLDLFYLNGLVKCSLACHRECLKFNPSYFRCRLQRPQTSSASDFVSLWLTIYIVASVQCLCSGLYNLNFRNVAVYALFTLGSVQKALEVRIWTQVRQLETPDQVFYSFFIIIDRNRPRNLFLCSHA